MLLSITTTYQPATDLGYLLHKHPDKLQTFKLSFGKAHVFYPEATEALCTATLLLDVDPIKLARGGKNRNFNFALQPYVNDRPYVASSFLSVAIAQVYGSALSGRCKEHPNLANQPIPLKAHLPAISVAGDVSLVARLFEPLGYDVALTQIELDAEFPELGSSSLFSLTLANKVPLQTLLNHLYVLIPVLDNEKHYWVGEDEIDKLLKRGESWLDTHPAREEIISRALKHRRHLTRQALAQLSEGSAEDAETGDSREDQVEVTLGLHQQRLQAVAKILKESGGQKIVDLGCGEGKLLRLLLQEPQFTQILGMDVSYRSLQKAQERLHLDELPTRQRERIQLRHGSLMYRDEKLAGYDCAAVVEVIEHLDADRLRAFEKVLFEYAKPKMIVITTPNREYNVIWPQLPASQFRHPDHRFEWSRAEFQAWATNIAARNGYTVRFENLGPEDANVGSPSQMGVFER
ncbi:3' terminal RNA ribose 2'-O-methyltransferase Hen1 [Candidatus Leptofilum sp.]|uniref:3' terminal RNA ribose 2'-O-methyltransferase Hen1 n=1 Tax=Candidatus Leptofilum sp. TaxID=3241576 RepID=UPI003B5BD600